MSQASEQPQTVAAPRAYLEAAKALDLVGRRAGQTYVVVTRNLNGLVGPFAIGQEIAVPELLAMVAKATGTELSAAGDVPVFQHERPDELEQALSDVTAGDVQKRRCAAFALGESQRLVAAAPLMHAVSDENRSVSRAALLALASLEGDFYVDRWPGRLSVFELPDVTLDVDPLMWLIEDGAEPASREWLAAVSVLGRARNGELSRSAWWNIYARRQGTILATIRALGRCGDRDMRNPLESHLRSVTTNVEADRFEAAAALAKIGEVRRLVQSDPESTAVGIRCAAAYGLGFSGTAETLDALKRMLADPDSRVAELAALSLGRHDSEEAVELLGRTLNGQHAPMPVRAAAANALGRSTRPGAAAALATETKAAEPVVAAAAADALGTVGGPRAVKALAPLLDADDRWLVAAAGRALASLGPTDASGKLASLLADANTDLEVRIAIAIGLGQSRAPEAAGPLSTVAVDEDADLRLRQYAARSLAMLADRAGQATLRTFLDGDPPLQLRLLALRHLDLGDPHETVGTLTWWATHGKPRHEQATAYERIGEIGTPEGTRFLAGGYETFDNYTRWTCIWPLIRNESRPVRRALIELLRGSRRRTQRTNAAIALGGPGTAHAAPPDPDAVDALIAACEDPAESVRVAAADSLGLIGDLPAAPALIKALQRGQSVRVAHHALRALRSRELASLPQVRTALEQARRTRRDCGAPGGPSLADQPANSFVLRCFDRDYDDLSLPNLSYESALCADGTGRIIQWGSHGRRYDSPQTGLTWLFDVKAGNWRRPAPKQEPPGICMTRGIVCDTTRGLVMATRVPTGMGGHGYVMYLRKFAAFSVPWVFDIAAGEWYPMRPAPHPGSAGYVGACFDWRNDAVLVLKNGVQVYDTHANTWTSLAPEPRPDVVRGCPPSAYDPVSGRLVVVTGADERGRAMTWAYDLAANTWTDLNSSNPPPALGDAPMIYDSANDAMLAFKRGGGRTSVYAYHPRENRWESLPAANPSPDYALFDAAYDPVNNVTVLCGGEDASCSGEPGVRETWTYRYRPAAKKTVGASNAPRALRLDISSDGAVRLSWSRPVAEAHGYHVYRGTGDHPWVADFRRITEKPLQTTEFTDPEKLGSAVHYYRVVPVGPDGEEGFASNIVRTQPLPVREVFAARGSDGSVGLSWTCSAGPAVAGYNVYRAPAEPLDLWSEHFDPMTNAGEFVKLNDKVVEETSFADRPGDDVTPCAETSWAPFQAYVVRAVNVLGVESGPSPATLSIPAPPGPLVVVPLEDGGRLVVSGASGSAPLAGCHLYRLDCYRGDLIFRGHGAPHAGTVFVDDQTWPVGDRQAYYVVPVDELGQLGVPSSPGWGREMP